jgi:acetyl-CoA carboxylase biotin carboxyl carrier protein
MEINIKQIKELIKLVESSDKVNELEVSAGNKSIKVKCGGQIITQQVQAPAQITAAPGQVSATPNMAPGKDKAPAPETAPGHKVKSPMVGTYYASSSPEAKPFVSIGQKIKVGDTLCIIEAMKMMNQIEAEVSGTVKQIIAQNEDPIEFDQILMIIEE